MSGSENQATQDVAGARLAEQELARPAATVMLSKEAETDLKKYGRVTRTILARAMRDELLEPSSSANFRPVPSSSGLFALPIGNFTVFFRRLPPETGEAGGEARVVLRIADEKKRPSIESTLTETSAGLA